MQIKGNCPQITRINTDKSIWDRGKVPAIFYDRRELFCPRILSFRSGSRWVRAHFLGKPSRFTREKENSHQQGFATSKAHKRETQGKHFDLFLIEPLRNFLSVKSCLLPYNNFRFFRVFRVQSFFRESFARGGALLPFFRRNILKIKQ